MAEKRMSAKELRKEVMKNSSLPYSFTYKIRHAFYGKICPICGFEMSADREFGLRTRIPTIQHNKPISRGGKHELGNISVICKNCNITIQDNETGKLNSKEVSSVWQMIKNTTG